MYSQEEGSAKWDLQLLLTGDIMLEMWHVPKGGAAASRRFMFRGLFHTAFHNPEEGFVLRKADLDEAFKDKKYGFVLF